MGDEPDDSLGGSGTEVDALPAPPEVSSRIDFLPTEFLASISNRVPAAGDVIGGRYRLIEPLGEGGMGHVFVAENVAIGRRVAVKVLKPALLRDADFRRRFQTEAMAIASIEHRNVARFIDVVIGDPTFLVMEHVPGRTLAAVLRDDRRIDAERAAAIAERLAWALDAAHRVGVIHRDIKPANVVLSPDEENGEEPKLIDFGLAKLPTIVGAEDLTRTGQIVGTPAYMAPEQISNSGVDARSDVYALGCLLFHMITGQAPFSGGDHVQILYQQMEVVPPKLRELAPDTPEALEAIVARSLAKAPADRYASMRDLIRALRATRRRREADLASGSSAFATSADERPLRRALRNWLMIAAVLAVMAAGLGYVAARGSRAPAATLVIVNSRPSGATVELDGKPLPESTPTALRNVAPGPHRLRVRLAGRDTVERAFDATVGERVSIDVGLPAATRSLEVQSVPPGAAIFLDDHQLAGETPTTVSLAADDFHQLRLERLGYEPEIRKLTPDSTDAQLVVQLVPEKQPRGVISVDSRGAHHVFIDGRDSGYVTPTLGIRVTAGPHVVEIRDSAGAIGQRSQVEVRRGESLHMILNGAGECR